MSRESHVCQCRACGTFPSGPRQGEGHVALRFGDEGRQADGRYQHHQVALNGEPATHVTEAFAGEHGWLVRYTENADGRPHRCACGADTACAEIRVGHVTVSSTLPAEVA